ncbi:hypothetical protein D3C81_653070 [compost metagenome]
MTEASGVRTYSMLSKGFLGTREIRQFQIFFLVEPNKPAKQGRLNDLPEVLLTDSTPRQGEPATWGSGQQKWNLSKATWAPYNGRTQAFIQRKEEPSHDNRIGKNSSKSTRGFEATVYFAYSPYL